MTDEPKPYVNEISDIEIRLDEDDDYFIIRLLSPRGWISCRIHGDRFSDALEAAEAGLQQAVERQLRQLR